jgi:hypothetical protein
LFLTDGLLPGFSSAKAETLVSGEHGAACKNPETRNQAATGSPSTTVLRLLLPYSIPKVVDFEVEAGVGKVVTHVIELLLQLRSRIHPGVLF